jgi:hypothetical protein
MTRGERPGAFACCFYALRRKVLNSSAPHFEKAAVDQSPRVKTVSLQAHAFSDGDSIHLKLDEPGDCQTGRTSRPVAALLPHYA